LYGFENRVAPHGVDVEGIGGKPFVHSRPAIKPDVRLRSVGR
jgi:hypothetical protein